MSCHRSSSPRPLSFVCEDQRRQRRQADLGARRLAVRAGRRRRRRRRDCRGRCRHRSAASVLIASRQRPACGSGSDVAVARHRREIRDDGDRRRVAGLRAARRRPNSRRRRRSAIRSPRPRSRARGAPAWRDRARLRSRISVCMPACGAPVEEMPVELARLVPLVPLARTPGP